MSKFKSIMLLFRPYEYYVIKNMAERQDMTICDYIHWLLNYEIEAYEDEEFSDWTDSKDYLIDHEE